MTLPPDMSQERLGATPVSGASRASRTYRPGRVCETHGCGTVLSIYNRGRYCSFHEPASAPRTRGRKIA